MAFRGTQGLDYKNWITNLRFNLEPYKLYEGAEVHVGFYSAYEAVASKVRAGFDAIFKKHPSAGIIFTGHSLGGALAVFAALDINFNYNLTKDTQQYLYTHGSPRVGDEEFSNLLFDLYPNGEYERIVHANDVVPHLPPPAFGYRHAGNEIWVFREEGTSYRECDNKPDIDENPHCSNSLNSS